QLAQTGPVEVIDDIQLASQFRDRFQDRRPPPVMARVTANEQHINGAILTSSKRRQLRIVCRKKVCRAASLLPDLRKDGWKVADDEVISGERNTPKRRRVPGNALFHATGKACGEVRFPARDIQVVEYFRP